MAFTIKNPGPGGKLRRIFQQIESEIRRITPRAGLGIDIDPVENGTQISTATIKPPGGIDKENAQGGGTSGGTSVNLYGAFNGAPALFHLVQTSAPTPL